MVCILDVIKLRFLGTFPSERIVQTIYTKANGTVSSYNRVAGTVTYHPRFSHLPFFSLIRSHGHVHVDNWASFSLRKANSDPDPLNWQIIGVSPNGSPKRTNSDRSRLESEFLSRKLGRLQLFSWILH